MTPKPYTAAFEASKDYIEQALPGKVALYRGAHSRGGRVADPDEIAKAPVFLASNDNNLVFGPDIAFDGGHAQV
jgi:NAD(P)-dependent dehydrogenase (short-subunit alcohol dehydrogenase family)